MQIRGFAAILRPLQIRGSAANSHYGDIAADRAISRVAANSQLTREFAALTNLRGAPRFRSGSRISETLVNSRGLICIFSEIGKKHANFELLPVGRVTLKEIDASDSNAAIRTKFRECYDVEKVKLIDFHRNLQIF